MGNREESESNVQPAPGLFTETRWSKVVLASQGHSAPSRQALEELCQRYWHSIFGFLRRDGCSPEDAEDLTQQFFMKFLSKNALGVADPSKGRFRNFLLRSLKNFRIDEARKSNTRKREGGKTIIATNLGEGEQHYEQHPDPNLTPEKLYDCQWMITLLDQALVRLRDEFEKADQVAKFEKLKIFLSQEPEPGCYEELARELDMTKGAIAKSVFRMRQRYAQLIRLEIRETVTSPEEVESELRELFG